MNLLRKSINILLRAKSSVLIFTIIFAVYTLSSFDVCWFPGVGPEKGFVFSSNWTEHLHSSEEFTVYYQISSLYEGRIWLSKDAPPEYSVDSTKIGDYYYALAEPVTAALLLPFYTIAKLFLGTSLLIRSVIVGMIVYTCLNALLVRKVSLQLNQSHTTANLAALLFAFTTMAFSYSRLLYPQPVVTMLMLFAIVFLLDYNANRKLTILFCFAFFYGLTLLSFNGFVITAPFFLYYILRIGVLRKSKEFYTIGLGLLPSLALFLIWNFAVTGTPLITPRQIDYPSINFQILYPTLSGTWLNLEGLMGSLFSPVGIFFVSPILFASLVTFSSFKSKAKDEAILFASITIVFWLFMSFANLGGNAGRDWWVGGWANIARYMYIPSTLLIIFASTVFEKINKMRSLLSAWIVSLMVIFSFLANLSYGIRHDLMVAHLSDFPSTSLLIWPYSLGSTELGVLSVTTILISLAYPIYLMINQRRMSHVDDMELNLITPKNSHLQSGIFDCERIRE